MSTEERKKLEKYLRYTYAGVFSEESIQKHIEESVEYGFSKHVIDWVAQSHSEAKKLLDIGSGFGSFVLLCREKGIDAIGIEMAEFEVKYARRRLNKCRPDDDPLSVYHFGNALYLPFSESEFDVVTLWNVMEHISDEKKLLKEVCRVLRPGGSVYLICPNYAAFRKEAHYLIPWIPLLPKGLGSWYIRIFGRNPRYFEEGIFCRTNWGLLRTLHRAGLRVKIEAGNSLRAKINDPTRIKGERERILVTVLKNYRMEWLLNLFVKMILIKTYFKLVNPLKNSIILHLQKTEDN